MFLALLKQIATSFIAGRAAKSAGEVLKGVAIEKITAVARERLELPKEAPEADIEMALVANPEVYAQLAAEASDLAMEKERTLQVMVQEQGETDRAATHSDDAFVRRARPAMLYLAGLSCFGLMVIGAVIALYAPDQLFAYAELVKAASMPLTGLMAAAGVYSYRRTTDKAIEAGANVSPVFGSLRHSLAAAG